MTAAIPVVHGAGASNGRGRIAVAAAYVFNGLALTSWNVRLSSIRDEMGITSADLGGFLTAGAVGTVVTALVAGRFVQRFGARRIYLAATALFAAAYLTLAAALEVHSFPLLLVASVVHGLAFACTNVPQAVLGAASERHVGRTILPQFHAAYSVGAAIGASIGGLLSGVGVSPSLQFLMLAAAAVVIRSAIARLVRPLDERMSAERSVDVAGRSDRTPWYAVWGNSAVLSIGALVFATSISEGAANNWASIALVDSFEADEQTAAAALTVFLVAQTIVRIGGGRLVDIVGRPWALAGSAAAAALGLALFVFAPTIETAIAASALWGAGAALVVPVGVGLVARDPVNGPLRVAAVTSLGSIANIAGPPLIGAAGAAVGVRPSLLFVVAALAMTAPLVIRLRERR